MSNTCITRVRHCQSAVLYHYKNYHKQVQKFLKIRALITLLEIEARVPQLGVFCTVLKKQGNIDKLSKTILMMLSITYFIN